MGLKYYLTALLIISHFMLLGQSAEFSSIFVTSEIDDFKNAFGYDFGYSLKNNSRYKISFHFSHYLKDAVYSELRIDESSNGPLYPEYYFYQINSYNQKFGLHLSLCKLFIDNELSWFGIGFSLSYNLFRYRKNTILTYYRPFPDSFFQQAKYKSLYYRDNRIGVDLFVEFEIKSIMSKKFNLFTRINTGLLTYGTFAIEKGSWDYPWLTKWLAINFGIRYNFKSKKAN